MPTICLNMIVKNESNIITRLFDSVCNIIDTYCICDTGSTDDTIEIIETYFKEKNISGKIIHKEFINFSFNRNFSYYEAKNMADYVLLLDADMVLDIKSSFDKDNMNADIYQIPQDNVNLKYYNTRLVSKNISIEYKGPTHEYIDILGPSTSKKIDDLVIIDLDDGGCKGNKFKRDIDLLEQGIIDEPKNARYYFYLANSYKNTGNMAKAIEKYKKVLEMGSWEEEVFYCYYELGHCYKNMGDNDNMLHYWLEGWNYRPTRAETLYEIIHYYRNKCKWNLCKLFYNIAKNIPYPASDILFVHKDVYDYKLLFEYSVFAWYIQETDISHIFHILMNRSELDLYSLFNNFKFYVKHLESSETITLNNSFDRIYNDQKYKFRSSSPSIIPYKDGYGVNLRYVNYNIQPNGVYDWVENIVTINKFLEFSQDLKIKSEQEIIFEIDDRQYCGIEDIKLIPYGENIYYTGTCYKQSNKLGIAGGKYNIHDLSLDYNEYTIADEQYCEKNWIFIPNKENEPRMIYSWHPFTLGKIIDNELQITEKKTLPHIFSLARGSTNGFLWDGGEKGDKEIWFVVHFVHQGDGEPRFYYHMFAIFDMDMNFKRSSIPFKFSSSPIEYCLGIIVEKNRIIVSHSEWDRESYIKIYEKEYIDTFFVK
jgi:glycosyltransferase involved in cell wall biosynthesis